MSNDLYEDNYTYTPLGCKVSKEMRNTVKAFFRLYPNVNPRHLSHMFQHQIQFVEMSAVIAHQNPLIRDTFLNDD